MDNKIELTPQQREMALYEAAVEKFGKIAQIDQAIEEMAELTVALNKYKRFLRGTEQSVHMEDERIDRINEERADVSIMLCQLDVIFGDNSEAECAKLEHLEKLVSGSV